MIADTNVAQRKGVCTTFVVNSLVYVGLGGYFSLLTLYCADCLHFGENRSLAIITAFLALVYGSSITGGYLGGKYSHKNMVILGGICCTCGYALSIIYSPFFLYLGLALYIAGYSLFCPNIMCCLGQIFPKDSPQREAAFTKIYIGMNIGALLAAFFSGFMVYFFEKHNILCFTNGYQIPFFIFTVCTLLATVIFIINVKNYTFEAGSTCLRQNSNNKKFTGVRQGIFTVLLFAPVIFFLLDYAQLSNYVLVIVAIAAYISGIKLIVAIPDREIRKKGVLFLILLLLVIAFYILYSLQPSLLPLFIRHNVNRNLFGIHIPSSSFYSLNPIFILIIGSVLLYFSAKFKSVCSFSTTFKFSIGLIFTGLGFVILFPAIALTADSMGLISAWWIIAAYMFLTTGELLISPLSYSMVGDLVPYKLEGYMMGLKQAGLGLGGSISMFVAQATLVDTTLTAPSSANCHYEIAFLIIGGITILTGIIVLCFVPKLRVFTK